MVKVVAKRPDWPGDDVAQKAVGRDESATHVVCLVGLIGSVNCWWNGIVIKMMILPDVAFGVEDGYLPVQVTTADVILNIHHLACHGRMHRCAIFRQDVDAVVKIGIIQITGIKLKGTVEVPNLLNREWPGVARVGAVRISRSDAG